ncbi:unnamed protein product [Penicillium camemberti]|uniref:Str. FM013 n=1 Tax=Penicillium camemberti (strain FM 013) TaxID=1429867 RepID=A0A0G4PM51_PENC3|nr:unnamed protein product [Penicillium camemberti]
MDIHAEQVVSDSIFCYTSHSEYCSNTAPILAMIVSLVSSVDEHALDPNEKFNL